MGYHLFSFGINTEKLKSVFGSKNQKTFELVKNSEIFEGYRDIDDMIEKDQITIETALKDIINGEILNQKSGYVYGYAVISLCATLGETLPYEQEIKLGYETDFIDKYFQEDFKKKSFSIEKTILVQNESPFKLPPIVDWPLIGFLSYSDLIKLQEKFKNIRITDSEIEELQDSDDEDEEDKGFAYAHIQGIIANIDYCVENNLDLITFCH